MKIKRSVVCGFTSAISKTSPLWHARVVIVLISFILCSPRKLCENWFRWTKPNVSVKNVKGHDTLHSDACNLMNDFFIDFILIEAFVCGWKPQKKVKTSTKTRLHLNNNKNTRHRCHTILGKMLIYSWMILSFSRCCINPLRWAFLKLISQAKKVWTAEVLTVYEQKKIRQHLKQYDWSGFLNEFHWMAQKNGTNEMSKIYISCSMTQIFNFNYLYEWKKGFIVNFWSIIGQ